MARYQSPTIVDKPSTPQEPRRSERDRTATTRFVQGWYSVLLSRLSLALGMGATEAARKSGHATAEGEASRSNDDTALQTTNLEACDEAPILHVVEKREEEVDQEVAVVGASEPRRSERARKATRRFEDGWFGERLPNLSAALGATVTVTVTDRKGR